MGPRNSGGPRRGGAVNGPSAGGESGSGIVPPRAITARSPLEAALVYAAAGWAVLPVAGMGAGGCGCRRACQSPGKHPIVRHGVHDATTDPVLIREWWRRSPGANVGIATGASSGLVVLDVDLPRGGRESLRTVVAHGRGLPRTLRARTGGGGLHLFYVAPRGVHVPNAAGRLPGLADPLPGIDLRGDGGYVVAPPSLHASGKRYGWDRRAIAPLPAWAWPPPPPTRHLTDSTPLTAGATAYGAAALADELQRVRRLVVGERNDGLNRAAFCLGRLVGGGELAEGLVNEALLCAALTVGLSQREAEATIRSGLRAGTSVPRAASKRPTAGRAQGERR